MIPWGAIISGAISLGSTIYGQSKAAQATQQAKGNVEQLRRENQMWYDRRYNEDATQRADAQRVLTRLSDELRKRSRGAAGRAAVTGGTEESVAAEKTAGTAAMADAVSKIAAQGDARKDLIENQYMRTNAGLTGELNQYELSRAQNVSAAGAGASEAAGGLGVSIDKYLEGLDKDKKQQ